MKVELKYQDGKKVLIVTAENDLESMALTEWSEDYHTIESSLVEERKAYLLLNCNVSRMEY